MSKTKEELNELKKDVEAVNEELQELTPEEIAQVSGGVEPIVVGPAVGRADDRARGFTTAGAELSGHGQVSVRSAL